MSPLRRVTLRCLCEDLTSDWRDVAEQRAFQRLRKVAGSDALDSAIVVALDDVPSTARASHPLVGSFFSYFEGDESTQLRESISGLTDPHWWKQKSSRWRGAATDAKSVGEGEDEAWLCAGGLRAGKESRDFYVWFSTAVHGDGAKRFLPAGEDRRLQKVEAKLARREAWLAQLRLAALVCLAEVDSTGEACAQHVPSPTPEPLACPLVHLRFELERVGDGDDELVELFLYVDDQDLSRPGLVLDALDAVRSVMEPVADAWRVLPGAGTGQIWSALISREKRRIAREVVDSGELPEHLADSALLLGIQSHYAPKSKIVDATIEGDAVRGLCGKWFVPTAGPDELPKCPSCLSVYDSLPE